MIKIVAIGVLMVYVIWVVVVALEKIIDPLWANGVGVLLGFAVLFTLIAMMDKTDRETPSRKK